MEKEYVIPYEGEKPYAFISYAHRDTDIVMPILRKMYEKGYRIWYDDGIAPGSEWPLNIAMHLKNSALVIAFLSPNSSVSDNCRREVFYAMEQKKEFLGIFLQETRLDEGMRMQIGIHQNIYRNNYSSEQRFMEEIYKCPDLEQCRGDHMPPSIMPSKPQRSAGFLSGLFRYGRLLLILVLILAVMAAGYSVLWLRPDTSYAAVGHDWEAATCTAPKICRTCGKTDGAPLEHQWIPATCLVPENCAYCGLTKGQAAGHQWQEATYSSPKTCVSCGETEGEPLDNPYRDLRIGDIFLFGSYEQDCNTSNGEERIEWIVLDKADGRILALSKYTLDYQKYHNTNDCDVAWESCDVRKWLNKTFLDHISEEEQKFLALATVPADPNPQFSVDAGGDTRDYVFLLSMSEVKTYYPDFRDRVSEATDYARARGVYVQPYTNRGCGWWLRTPGQSGSDTTSVNWDGSFNHDGSAVTGDKLGVRPAIWIVVE